MRLSLRFKIIIAILLVITFFGTLATVLVFNYTKKTLFEKEKDTLEILSNQIGREVDQFFNQGSMLVKSIAQEDFSQLVLVNNMGEVEFSEALIHLNHYNINGMYSALYIMNSYGDTIISTDPAFVGKNYSFRKYFQDAINKNPSVDVAVGVTSKEMGYYFAHPIISQFGEVVGVVVAKMKPDFLHKNLDNNNFKNDIILTEEDGVIIYSNKENLIYKTLGELDEKTLKKIETERRFEGLSLDSAGYTSIKDNFLLGENKVIEFYNYSNKRKELFALTLIGDDQFSLVLIEDVENLIFSVQKIAWLIATFVILAALTASIILTFLISYILKPLYKIQVISEQLSQGNYDVEITDRKNNDELGDLIVVFKKMINSIKKSKQEVEEKVIKRTGELEKLNKFMTGRELRMVELKRENKNLKEKLNNK